MTSSSDESSVERRRKHSNESISSSDEDSYHKKKLKKHKSKTGKSKRKEKKSERKKGKKKRKDKEKERCKRKKSKKDKKVESEPEDEIGPILPSDLSNQNRNFAPMSKEQWEAKQKDVRRVLDEETGRYRLIRGEGEIIEEIVSKERHKEINKMATVSDGVHFQNVITKKKTV